MKRLVLITALTLFPFYAEAEPPSTEDGWSGHVTLGTTGVNLDHESFKYGEYSGVTDDGVRFLGDAYLSYNNSRAYYLDVKAENVGLQNRRMALESGKYGQYKMTVDYNEIIKLGPSPSRTPLDGVGGTDLTLPAGFVTGNTTPTLTTLASSLKDVDLKQKRRIGGVGLSTVSVNPVVFDLSFIREYKEGLRSLGGPVGSGGGNARSIVLPELVDYITDKLNAMAGYNGETAQVQLEYTLSLFSNQDESFTWQTPFNVTNATYQSPIPATGLNARTSLPPDNQYHRFALSGGINLPLTSRFSGVVEYGIMKQDEDLLPFSTSTTTSLLPRSSADAEIDTRGLTVALSSRPLERLGLNVAYKYYATDNKMPRDLFQYVILDNVNGTQNALTANNALYSLPYDWVQRQLKFDVSYYLFSGTSLLLGYDRDVRDRDFREVNTTKENIYRARLTSSYFSLAKANVNYSLSQRNAVDDYSGFQLYTADHTSAYIATQAANVQFDNLPEFRKFDIADLNRTKFGINLTTFPHYTTTVGLYYNLLRDDFNHSSFGLQEQTSNSATIDVSMTPTAMVSTHLYYTREDITFHQASRSFGGGATKGVQSVDPNRNWEAAHETDVDTVGVGLNVSFLEDKLTIITDYTFSESDDQIDLDAGSALVVPEDMPKLRTKLNSVNLTTKYKFTERLTVGLGYQFEAYESDDWATDGVDPSSTVIPAVLTLSGSTPDYTAHLATVFVTVTF